MTEKTAEIFDKKVIGERVRSLRTSANNPKKKEKNTGKKKNKTGYSMDQLLLEIDLIIDTNNCSFFISKSTICNIENGKTLPSPEFLSVFCYFFNKTFDEIILGKNAALNTINRPDCNFLNINKQNLRLPNLDQKEIGIRIYELRTSEKFSLRKFSDVLNQKILFDTVYKTYCGEICKIEAGQCLPPLHYAFAIAQYFNISLDYIYFGL